MKDAAEDFVVDSACATCAYVVHFRQQTSRASACMRNSGGIFLPRRGLLEMEGLS